MTREIQTDQPTIGGVGCVDQEKLLETVTQTPEQANAAVFAAMMLLVFGNAMLISAFRALNDNAVFSVFPVAIGVAFVWHLRRVLRDRRHGVSYVLYSDRLELNRGGKTKSIR